MAKRGPKEKIKQKTISEGSAETSPGFQAWEHLLMPTPLNPEYSKLPLDSLENLKKKSLHDLIRLTPSKDLVPQPSSELSKDSLKQMKHYITFEGPEDSLPNPDQKKFDLLVIEYLKERKREIEHHLYGNSKTIRIPENFKSPWEKQTGVLSARRKPLEALVHISHPLASLYADILLYDEIKAMYGHVTGVLNKKMAAILNLFEAGLLSSDNSWNSRPFWIDAYNTLYRLRDAIPTKHTYGPLYYSIKKLKRSASQYDFSDIDVADLFVTLLDVAEKRKEILSGISEHPYELLLETLRPRIREIQINPNEGVLHLTSQ